MEGNVLKYQAFLECVRQGGITAAAKSLSYSQSAISRMIGDLEREWGFKLLERGHAGTRVTPEGKRLLPTIEDICLAQRSLVQQVDDINGLRTGSVRMGVFSSVATHRIPEVIYEFQQLYPNIEYELLTGDFYEIEQWVLRGRVDLGFLPHRPKSHELGFDEFEKDELLAVLPCGHPLAKLDAVPVESLCHEPFILLQKSDDDEVTSIFDKNKQTPQVRITTWDDYAIMSMVECGLGISILPELILKRNAYKIEIRSLVERSYRHIGVVYRTNGTLALAAERFLSYMGTRRNVQEANG